MASKAPALSSSNEEIIAERSKWKSFLLLGLVLMAGGLASISLPDASTYATSNVLGVALIIIGVVKIIQSLWVKNWRGFIIQEATGAVELIGGIMVYLNPLKGALALSIFIAVMIAIHGVMQIALSIQLRKNHGAGWFAISGIVAFLSGLAILFKLPFVKDISPSTIAGLALLIAGLAYILMAFSRKLAQN
ncbi:HdeD family acid-resistance protein [Brucellaceae bacterium D45D]